MLVSAPIAMGPMSPRDGDIRPDAGALADGDVANDDGAGVDIGGDSDTRGDAAERTNHVAGIDLMLTRGVKNWLEHEA